MPSEHLPPWQAEYDRRREEHVGTGRIAGSTGIASFCSCGLAFCGATKAEADNQLMAHQHYVRGTIMTSRSVDAETLAERHNRRSGG